jgi:hypothetical protein
LAQVSFNIYFEEMWDFYLNFMDWKTTSLEKETGDDSVINPSLEFRLISKNSIETTSTSEVLKATKLPHWSLFEDGI